MTREYLFTSESVSEGHPDKAADQVSDAVLDWLLTRDRHAKVACETLIAKNFLAITGEFRANFPDLIPALQDAIPGLARTVLDGIGYTAACGFDPTRYELRTVLNRQSDNIDQGVERGGGELGAGDQGLMFGYACNETPELMPTPVMFAHRLGRGLTALRKGGKVPWLRPDAKSQVSIRYEDGRPVEIVNVVISTQHTADVAHGVIEDYLIERLIKRVLPARLLTRKTEFLVNPTGRFVVGGPEGDSGLTGRKIIVDSYGGWGRHGGGAFSGKDPSKVDRSAAYMCRWVAKNIVAAGLADAVELQVAYAIGYPEPVSIYVDTQGTGKIADEKITRAVRAVFSFKPADIIRQLDLLRPIYRQTTNYGHFGKSGLAWEKTDKIAALRAAI